MDKVTEREILRHIIIVVLTALAFAWAVMHYVDEYDGGKKYTIETEHGIYHTDQFRICGKGIAFDTEDKKVIVLGNFNIISNLEQ